MEVSTSNFSSQLLMKSDESLSKIHSKNRKRIAALFNNIQKQFNFDSFAVVISDLKLFFPPKCGYFCWFSKKKKKKLGKTLGEAVKNREQRLKSDGNTTLLTSQEIRSSSFCPSCQSCPGFLSWSSCPLLLPCAPDATQRLWLFAPAVKDAPCCCRPAGGHRWPIKYFVTRFCYTGHHLSFLKLCACALLFVKQS